MKTDKEKIREVEDRLDRKDDDYSIEWPLVSSSWNYGTYVNEILKHYMPWITTNLKKK